MDLEEKNGEIYVGGVNGVTKFDPKQLQLKMGTSDIIIDSIKI